MIIKQSKQLEYDLAFNAFFSLRPQMQTPMSLINIFFLEGFGHLKGGGKLNFMQRVEKMLQHGIGFENIRIAIDNLNNLVYINEIYYDKNKPTTDEIEKLLDDENEIELCKIGFLEHVILTKENFMHIILSWDKAINQKSPFVLLYQDEKGWFDILPFDSQEAMEKFVEEHTGNEQENIKILENNDISIVDSSKTSYEKMIKIITILFFVIMFLIKLMNLIKIN